MPKIQSPFRLDKELHWARLSSEERSRQEALLEFLMTEQSYYERLTILYQVYPKGLALSVISCRFFSNRVPNSYPWWNAK